MRKHKAFLVVSLVLLLLGMGAWGCNQRPTCTPCPPTPTCPDTSGLEARLEACEATLTAIAGEEGPVCAESDTICNGKDDDCDGDIDEDYQPYRCGVGACERLSLCVQGIESCTPGEEQPEICDNRIDDDCDGLTDTEDPDCEVVCSGAISCAEALANVGEVKMVRGKVVDTHYASSSSGQPTFLNLCYPYSDSRRFTALIWGEDRQEFIDCLDGPPEQVLLNREVCVEGLIEIYEGTPEIIITKCGQLTVIQ